jgi:hypothetical protein
MRRDYEAMRSALATAATSPRPVRYGGFCSAVPDEGTLRQELERLGRDGLIDNGIRFQDGGGCCLGGEVSITDEGREFFNLIENDRVWELMRGTLDAAGIDVPYPLLKEVCEEIVRRYVASFIPDIEPHR